MTFSRFLAMGAAVAALSFTGAAGASAADSCIDQVKAAASQGDSITDADAKAKFEKLLQKAEKEATEEMDEDECMDALKDAKAVLGM